MGGFSKLGTGLAEEGHAVGLEVDEGRDAAHQHEADEGDEHGDLLFEAVQVQALDQREGDDELAGEAVEGGQAGYGSRAEGEEHAEHGHALLKAAELGHVHSSGAVQDFARAEEEQSLEGGMVEHMEEAAGEAEGGYPCYAVLHAHEADAGRHDHEAHVLHAGVGQQAFQMALAEGFQYAHEGGEYADAYEEPAPPCGVFLHGAEEVEGTDDAVEACVQHGAGKQGGNVAGSRRMGFREPDMQGCEAGLGAEADDGEEEEQGGVGRCFHSHGGEERGAVLLPEHGEESDEEHSAQMRRHQIDPRGVLHVAVAVVEVDEEEGRERHEFPGEHKEQAVAGGHHAGHAEEEDEIEGPVRAEVMLFGIGVAQGDAASQRAGEAQHENRQEEEAGKRVEAEGQCAEGQAPGSLEAFDARPAAGKDSDKAQQAGNGRRARAQGIGRPVASRGDGPDGYDASDHGASRHEQEREKKDVHKIPW